MVLIGWNTIKNYCWKLKKYEIKKPLKQTDGKHNTKRSIIQIIVCRYLFGP